MGSCYSGDHIAGDQIHTDITSCNIEEPQQKCHLETVSNIFPHILLCLDLSAKILIGDIVLVCDC